MNTEITISSVCLFVQTIMLLVVIHFAFDALDRVRALDIRLSHLEGRVQEMRPR